MSRQWPATYLESLHALQLASRAISITLLLKALGACGLAPQARGEELAARGVARVRSKPKHAFVPIRVKSTAVIKRSSGAN